MSGRPRHDRQPPAFLRLALLLAFTGVLAVQTVGSIGSIVAFSRQSNATLRMDERGADGYELRSLIRNGGLRISGVVPQGPAGRAGLRDGDLIVEVNGRRLADHPDAYWRPAYFGRPGDTLALTWIRGGDPAEAMKQAAALDALDSLAGAYAWAAIWENIGDVDRASAAFRRAIAHDTSATDRARYLLGLYLVRAQEYDTAAAVFAGILERRPGDLLALYQLGKVDLLRKRNLDRAVLCFRRYLASPVPEGGAPPALARYRLGQIYDLQGKRDSALAELRQALALLPGDQGILSALREAERRP